LFSARLFVAVFVVAVRPAIADRRFAAGHAGATARPPLIFDPMTLTDILALTTAQRNRPRYPGEVFHDAAL
jgi:hypothetical protein